MRYLLAVIMLVTQTAFTIYTPIAARSTALKGVGMTTGDIADIDRLGAEWWYDWTAGTGNKQVPMYFTGNENNLPETYNGYLMLFNEPENGIQTAITPEQGAERYRLVTERLPSAKIIVGNISMWGAPWIAQFKERIAKFPHPAGWGCHGYAGEFEITALDVIRFWQWCKDNLPGELWITEYADVQGRIDVSSILINWVSSNTNRGAWFANRVDTTAWWYPGQWPDDGPMALIRDNKLTELGHYYKNFGTYFH